MNKEILEIAQKYNNSGMYGIFQMYKEFLDSGLYNQMLKDIGLSLDYTKEDLNIIDKFFRNKESINYTGDEFLSTIVFGIYIARIFEKNNSNIEWRILKDSDRLLEAEDNRIMISITNKEIKYHLFPLARLSKITIGKPTNSLIDWYNTMV